MSKPASSEKPTIFLALAAIAQAIEAVKKSRDNTAQGYKYRGIDDLYNELHPIFAANGVLCLPSVVKIEHTIPGKFKNGQDIYRAVVTVAYKLVGPDGSSVESTTVGEGFDLGDKSTGKALSMAHKYFLIQTFLIPTADLVDIEAGDYTVDPVSELRALKEENARLRVLQGGEMDLPDDAARALEDKRRKLQADIDAREAAEATAKQTSTASGDLTLDEGKTAIEKTAAPKAPASEAKQGGTSKQEPAPKEPAKAPEAKTEAKQEKAGKAAESFGDHVIAFIAVAGIKGKKVSELNADQIKLCKVKWVDAHKDKIKLDPRKVVEAKAVEAAFAELSA